MSACIVCGVDGSHEADKAAAVAARLARDLGSEAVLVHVQETPPNRRSGRLPRPRRDRRRRRLLAATARECCCPGGTRLRLRSGEPRDELIGSAREEEAELIVVSTGGQGTASPVLIGGTAGGLMRMSPCPVVVVPPQAVPPLDAAGLQHVVCGIGGRPGDHALLELAADLAGRLEGELHAVGDADALLDSSELPRGVEVHCVEGPMHEAVARVANRTRAGLVVVSGPNGGDEWDIPAAISLAARGDVPVVVLPGAAEIHAGSGHYELTAAAG